MGNVGASVANFVGDVVGVLLGALDVGTLLGINVGEWVIEAQN